MLVLTYLPIPLLLVLQVTILVIFFPVARTLLTFLRRAPFLKCVIPFDSNLTFHRFFGYICMGAFLPLTHHCALNPVHIGSKNASRPAYSGHGHVVCIGCHMH